LEEIGENNNILDLWIGEVFIEENLLGMALKGKRVNDLSKILNFITIDFYNHDTQHTDFGEGLKPSFDS
jgi:hypothetical protein